MGTPFKRKASIGLKFSDTVDMSTICKTIFGKLHIKYDDIVGFQECKYNRVEVKFLDADVHRQFAIDYAGKEIVLDNDHISVKVVNLSDIYTYVAIKYAPYDLPNDTITKVLNRYGQVEGIRWNKYTYGDATGLLNGTRTAKMILHTHVPSSVTVLNQSIVFMYQGQTRTCHKCGRTGHMAFSCKNESKVNIFNEENFPALNMNENEEGDEGEGENEATDEMISKESEKVENTIAVDNTDQNVNELDGATETDEIEKAEKTEKDKTVMDKAEGEIENINGITEKKECKIVECENSNGIKNSEKITENNIPDSSDTQMLSRKNDTDILNVAITQDPYLESCSETFEEQTDKEIKDIMTNSCNETLHNKRGKNNKENETNSNILDDESNKNMHMDSMRKLNTHI